MVSVPPPGMASRAFYARFITTCSICTGSALTLPRSCAGNEHQFNILANQARGSMMVISPMTVFRSSTCNDCICLRPNASNWQSQVIGGPAGRGHNFSFHVIFRREIVGGQRVQHQLGVRR